MRRSRRPRPTTAITAVAAAALVVPLCATGAAHAGAARAVSAPRAVVGIRTVDYPSWDQVQAAKADVAATQAEVQQLQALVSQLQEQAEQASAAELAAEAKATQAQQRLADATATADRLESRAEQAEDDADDAKRQIASLASQLYRGQAASPTAKLLTDPDGASQLLGKLSDLDQVSRIEAALTVRAKQTANVARSLRDQADAAKAERARRSADAQQALAEAQQASQAAQAAVADQQAHEQTLFAQLATLKNTAASTEADYYAGLAAQQSHNGGAGADVGISTSGVGVNPGDAKAYASSRLGAYGWGQDQYSCLVSLWTQESGWRANAYNTSSGAYGIPQSLPAYKMSTAGADWRTNAHTQIEWGLGYIKRAYGSPCAAWGHEGSHNWY